MVVVGGGLSGLRICQQLRARGHSGPIVLVGAESVPPYDRPPLTKAVLTGERGDTTLGPDLADLGVEARLGMTANTLRLEDRVVETSAGDVEFDGLAVVTGTAPIRLPGTGPQLTLRTSADAARVREALVPGARVVIAGAGWIGAEVATVALARGCRVTCVEAAPTVAAALGESVGRRLATWWAGAELLLGEYVESVGAGEVALRDGTTLPADVVISAVGVRPATAWLAGSGLALEHGGVVVDERLVATAGVVAAGDVAAWWSRRYGRRLRVEHWDNAVACAPVAAASLLAVDDASRSSHDPVPYFWSDQFGHKLQYLGHHDPADRVVIRDGATGSGRGSRPSWDAVWIDTDNRISAVLVVNRPRDVRLARTLADARPVVDLDRLADPGISLNSFATAAA